MDVIYTDTNGIEQGVLHNFEIDFDTTNTMDFQITTGISNNVLQGSAYWYIEGTEYGGKIDKITPLSESREKQYTGRNARGLLVSKIVEPPAGSDYLILSGTMQGVIQQLINVTHYNDLIVADYSSISVSNYKVNRYVNLYDAIVKLMATYHKIPKFTFKLGKIHISTYESTDYSDSNEYTQDDLHFNITKSFSDVNHLICLGAGELKDRMVVHLYADKDGNVSEKQSIFGAGEVESVYENTNAESKEDLIKEGTAKLEELKTKDSFNVTIPQIELSIGDIVGGYDADTGIYVAREIVNTIVNINDYRIEVEHKVGEDDTKGAGTPSSGETATSKTPVDAYNLPPATTKALGGVIVGTGLDVKEDGLLSVIVDDLLSEKSANPVQNKTIVNKLNEIYEYISIGKKFLTSVITDKGVPTEPEATFETIGNNIYKIFTDEFGIYGLTQIMSSYSENGVTVSASSEYKGRPAYQAVGRDANFSAASTFWLANEGGEQWLQIEFEEMSQVFMFSAKTYRASTLKFQYYDEISQTWADATDEETTTASQYIMFYLKTSCISTKFRVYMLLNLSGEGHSLGSVNLYGRKSIHHNLAIQ